MGFVEFIKTYQALIGSFLAIFSSVCLWYLKEAYDKRKQIQNNKKEIENIFFMAARESEDALKDLKSYISSFKNHTKSENDEITVCFPPRFNRIYINEERLFFLKQNLGFIFSQQIEIAVSSVKKLNGFLGQVEATPGLLFDSTIKILQSGIATKEKSLKDYFADQRRFLNMCESMLNDIEIVQKHLLRPIVVQNHQDSIFKGQLSSEMLDKILDEEAKLVLMAIKHDLA